MTPEQRERAKQWQMMRAYVRAYMNAPRTKVVFGLYREIEK